MAHRVLSCPNAKGKGCPGSLAGQRLAAKGVAAALCHSGRCGFQRATSSTESKSTERGAEAAPQALAHFEPASLTNGGPEASAQLWLLSPRLEPPRPPVFSGAQGSAAGRPRPKGHRQNVSDGALPPPHLSNRADPFGWAWPAQT